MKVIQKNNSPSWLVVIRAALCTVSMTTLLTWSTQDDKRYQFISFHIYQHIHCLSNPLTYYSSSPVFVTTTPRLCVSISPCWLYQDQDKTLSQRVDTGMRCYGATVFFILMKSLYRALHWLSLNLRMSGWYEYCLYCPHSTLQTMVRCLAQQQLFPELFLHYQSG